MSVLSDMLARLEALHAAPQHVIDGNLQVVTRAQFEFYCAAYDALPVLLAEHRLLGELERDVRAASEVYEGLRTDANDGEFAFWSEDDLVSRIHSLHYALACLDEHREQQQEAPQSGAGEESP